MDGPTFDCIVHCPFTNRNLTLRPFIQFNRSASHNLCSTSMSFAKPSPVSVRQPSSSWPPFINWNLFPESARYWLCAILENLPTKSRTNILDSANIYQMSRLPSSTVVHLWPRTLNSWRIRSNIPTSLSVRRVVSMLSFETRFSPYETSKLLCSTNATKCLIKLVSKFISLNSYHV